MTVLTQGTKQKINNEVGPELFRSLAKEVDTDILSIFSAVNISKNVLSRYEAESTQWYRNLRAGGRKLEEYSLYEKPSDDVLEIQRDISDQLRDIAVAVEESVE